MPSHVSGSPIYTVGHSNRALSQFIALLEGQGVRQVLDIRTAAGSRRNPQFGRDELPPALASHGIVYERLPELGGFRKPQAMSPNMGWRNESFRAFADYMSTPEFETGIDRLISIARGSTTAIMCAEAVPWRCHRSLVADALLVRGIPVMDIIGPTSIKPHALTPFAHVEGTRITYPEPADDQGSKQEANTGNRE